MNFGRFAAFAAKVVSAHVTTYFLAGAIAYPLLTKEYYVGQNPIFAAFLRTEADPALWGHVVRWFLPAEILRGLLISIVLYPLFDVLKTWAFTKRWLLISALLVGLGFWAAAVPAPGTLEGMIYMRPFITPAVHLRVQPENILQGLALAFFVAGAMMR
ncbi:MAG TPA: hypothetical protein VFD30_12005 [Terriglobia bacterium]|jgi:hypothetical protein|nr:hypothetical protein [Terriglobia bacterium]